MNTQGASITKRESAAFAVGLLALSLIALSMTPPSIRGHDGPGHYVYLRSVLVGGDLDFRDDYAAFDRLRGEGEDPGFRLSDAPVSPVTGNPANRYGIGAALFWAPFVAPVHLILNRVAPESADGTSQPYQTAVGVASAWWGCLALWLLYGRLREEHSRRVSLIALGGMVFATPLSFYIWAHGSMSHAVSFFAVTCAMLMFEVYLKEGRRTQGFMLGCCGGLIVLTRVQDATWSFMLFAFFVWRVWGGAAAGSRIEGGASTSAIQTVRSWQALILCGLGFALTMLPQIAVWKILYGDYMSGPAPYMNREGGSFSLMPVHFLQALFSGRHGAFSWHPILLVAFIGLAVLARAAKDSDKSVIRILGFLGLAGFAAQLWAVGGWNMWWAGASFGNRFFISSYPFLLFGLARVIGSMDQGAPRWMAPAIIALLIVWNGGLLVQYGTEIIPREEHVPMFEIILNQFAEVPGVLMEQIARRL